MVAIAWPGLFFSHCSDYICIESSQSHHGFGTAFNPAIQVNSPSLRGAQWLRQWHRRCTVGVENRIVGISNLHFPDSSLNFHSSGDVGWGYWSCITELMPRALLIIPVSSPTLTPHTVSRVKCFHQDEQYPSLERECIRAHWTGERKCGGCHQGQWENQGHCVSKKHHWVHVSCAGRRIAEI